MLDTELPLILRYLINDVATPQTYDDTRLLELLIASAILMRSEISFPTNYQIDLEQQLISPDPTGVPGGGRDEDFMALLCLKAAAILATAESKTSAGQGILIRDGTSMIDLKETAKYKIEFAKAMRKQYEDARWQYIAGKSGVGKALLSPFRVYMPTQQYGSFNNYPLY